MRKILILFVVMSFVTVSCSNSVTKINDEESVNDNSSTTDNNTVNDEEQNESETADSVNNDETVTDDSEKKDEVSIPDEDTVGNECVKNDDCSANEFCIKENGFCDDSSAGTCAAIPENCYLERVISPVCGCDNYTYASTCWAKRVGVNVLHDGECEGDTMCWNNEACESDEYCEKKIGVCDMSSGVCRQKPNENDCPPPGITQPFCGCDLYEYEDICYSSSGGIPIKHMGACNGPDDSKFYYFFGANAQSPNGSLRVVMSETDIREYTCSEQHLENMDNDGNYITITINFKNTADAEHAQLQFTVLASDVTSDSFPFGMGLGYHESYLKVYDASENMIAEMQGTVMIYDYSPLFISSQIPTLDVRGLNLWVKE